MNWWKKEVDQINESIGCFSDVKRFAEFLEPDEDLQDFINLM
jgi:hypothetical protein